MNHICTEKITKICFKRKEEFMLVCMLTKIHLYSIRLKLLVNLFLRILKIPTEIKIKQIILYIDYIF